MSPTDQDYEWNACFLIEADSQAEALQWGNKLAANHCQVNRHLTVLQSYIDPQSSTDSLPIVIANQEVVDDVIGW